MEGGLKRRPPGGLGEVLGVEVLPRPPDPRDTVSHHAFLVFYVNYPAS